MKKGSKVSISDLETETATVSPDAGPPGLVLRVAEFDPEGEVVETRDHPPHVDEADLDADANPSPHVLVRMTAPSGEMYDVWFNAARVTEL